MSELEIKLRRKLRELLEHESFMLEVLSCSHPESEEAFCALASVILNSELILRAKDALLRAKSERNEGKK
jgi:hypothetical protein